MGKSHFIEAAEACIANGERLLDDVDWMIFPDRPAATCFVLATIAQEEFAKALLLFLADKDVIAWNPFVGRAARDHACKQLLGLVLKHLSPDDDEDDKRRNDFWTRIEEHKRLIEAYKTCSDQAERNRIWQRVEEIGREMDSIPQCVADAIFILRYEKIGRWESSTWVWQEEPTYDALALAVAGGSLDREKQDALYVRLGRDGHVATTPAITKFEDAKGAVAMASRMCSFVKYLVSQNVGLDRDYEKIESAFKTVFASLNEKSLAASASHGAGEGR